MNSLSPSRRQPPSLAAARVAIAATSEPASGSVSANAAMPAPRANAGSSARWASLPASAIACVPRPCTAKIESARGET